MNKPTAMPVARGYLRVILTGFMGAGKTTVGRHLAKRLGWDFADSDFLVEASAGMTVGEIFAHRGEAAFRRLEAEAIRRASSGQQLVMALGGGALEAEETRDHLASLADTLVVFLDAPLETLAARCSAETGGPVRPVLADRARLEERWRARLPWYQKAHLTVDTTHRKPEVVVDDILERLGVRDPAGQEDRDAASMVISGKTGVSS